MIHFCCWYCDRNYAVASARAGEVLTCSCDRRLRVPRTSGGDSRYRSLTDWLVEAIVYGGGGALLGFGLALALIGQFRLGLLLGRRSRLLLVTFTLVGFLAGLFGGERGVNWLGRMIRSRGQN